MFFRNVSLQEQLYNFTRDILITSIINKKDFTEILYQNGISSVIYNHNDDTYTIKDGNDLQIVHGKYNISDVICAWQNLGYKV